MLKTFTDQNMGNKLAKTRCLKNRFSPNDTDLRMIRVPRVIF